MICPLVHRPQCIVTITHEGLSLFLQTHPGGFVNGAHPFIHPDASSIAPPARRENRPFRTGHTAECRAALPWRKTPLDPVKPRLDPLQHFHNLLQG